uniref:Uncharacterized protein n=1 Tax=Oryza brachyantha TaxID=4533 RepID=J3L7P5_ORYBR
MMSSSTRFSYRRLKKLPPAPDLDYGGHGGAVGRRRVTWRRRRRPRLRISGLTRALRRKAAAVGGAVRASVTKVLRRLREGSPYVGDLFAGNYMFMQVPPSPTMAMAAAGGPDKGVAALPSYYRTVAGKNALRGATTAPWRHSPAVLYKA